MTSAAVADDGSSESPGSGAAPTGWLRRLVARFGRWFAVIKGWLAKPLAPIAALSLLLIVSLVAQVYKIDQPCTAPCKTVAAHTLIFDEAYYVSAAEVIAGIKPAASGKYSNVPLNKDPNAEHPQLAKVLIAGGIKLFGDNAKGWRLPSVLFTLIALAAIYGLVIGLGGSGWLAVGTTAVAALDNMLMVTGRIAILDIFGVAMMLVSANFYVRGRPLLAGIALGIGVNMKETSLYLLAGYVLFEAARFVRSWWVEHDRSHWFRNYARPAGIVVLASLATFFLVFWIMDLLVPAYDPGTKITYAGSPFTHFFHIFHYAGELHAVPNAVGIPSTPWEWLLDQRAIDYARVAVNSLSNGQIIASRATLYFQGEVNPFIIFLAIPALFTAVWAWWRENDRLSLFGAAWVLGTYLPAVYESTINGRVAYLYYILVSLPGLYLILARFFSRKGMPTAATLGWAVALVYSALNLYPIRTIF
jgi:4-amino-4-deoxy-L-arabinose transferase-like glycosyltransferase